MPAPGSAAPTTECALRPPRGPRTPFAPDHGDCHSDRPYRRSVLKSLPDPETGREMAANGALSLPRMVLEFPPATHSPANRSGKANRFSASEEIIETPYL